MKTRWRWLRHLKWLPKACVLLILTVLAGLWVWGRYSKEVPSLVIPEPSLPRPNAYDDYAAAFQLLMPRPRWNDAGGIFFGYGGGPSGALYSGNSAQKSAVVRANAPALVRLRRGFAHDFRQPPIRSFYLTRRQRYGDLCREMARLLRLESQVRGAQGNWHGAADSALDAMHLGYDFPRGGAFPSPMVGWAIRTSGSDELWRVLPHLDATQARAAAQRLALDHCAKKNGLYRAACSN